MLSISTFATGSSTDAYQELMQKKLDIAKKNAAATDGLSRKADQDQKALARQRVDEIKKEIEALRKMLALFGGKDAKALLQQLKQLASQLKQVSGVLRAAPENSVPDTQTPDGYGAYAEQQASADAEAATTVQPVAAPFDAQRAEDEKQLDSVSQSLKGLRATVERLVRQQDHKA
ncbi:hypothetical protein [Duganella radicis]|uniref:Uncharacterized protein n=1 Tax=Duganella radicis TaxID=551988 RepID=A0A6L6PF35_9BURK|nr:hypothetical protein [Duganella radicis]MTV37563.1 hypothetical protein [Duganella radicis]